MVEFVLWGDAMAYKRQERSGFMVLHRSRLQLKYLSDAERGKLLLALLDYSEHGVAPDFTGTLGMAYETMAEQIDFYDAKYKTRCETNSKNRQSTMVDDGRRASTMVDNGDQSKSKSKSKSNQIIPPKSPKGDMCTDAFTRFWEAYPKKKDKTKARKAFEKALKQTDLDTMLQALEAQKRSPDWQRDGGQYIPLPTTWLNGCRWEDETTEPETAIFVPRAEHIPEIDW